MILFFQIYYDKSSINKNLPTFALEDRVPFFMEDDKIIDEQMNVIDVNKNQKEEEKRN